MEGKDGKEVGQGLREAHDEDSDASRGAEALESGDEIELFEEDKLRLVCQRRKII